MELYADLLRHLLDKQTICVSFPDLHGTVQELLEGQSYRILQDIIAIIKNDALDDVDCFARIEEIVSLLEKNGIDTGNRHDFG